MRWIISVALCLCLCAPLLAADPNAAPPGVTAWGLFGANPEFGKSQELRLGYDFGETGLLPGIELAVAGIHFDGPDAQVQESRWSGRAYAIAHAVSTAMVGLLLGSSLTLPTGNLYLGAFGEYDNADSKRVSGGYILGGLVDWPKGWQSVVEYQAAPWNRERDSYSVVFGLRRKF
jgi:hypothetical protein